MYSNDYLHYWGINASADISWARARANQSRAQTMIGQRAAMRGRKNDAAKQFQQSSSLANATTIADFLDGQFIDTIPSLSEQALNTGSAANINLDAARTALQQLRGQITDFQSLATGLSNIINQIFSTENQQA